MPLIWIVTKCLEAIIHIILRNLKTRKLLSSDQNIQSSLKFSNITLDILRHQWKIFKINLKSLSLQLLLQDCDPCFKVRSLNICYQSLLKPWSNPLFQKSQFLWGTIRRNNNLLFLHIKIVKEIVEYFLSSILSRQKLNIINKQNIYILKLF